MLNTGHFQELRERPNVLLLGDSLGDLTMADGVQDMQNILKIGFLNDKVLYFQMCNFCLGSSAEAEERDRKITLLFLGFFPPRWKRGSKPTWTPTTSCW